MKSLTRKYRPAPRDRQLCCAFAYTEQIRLAKGNAGEPPSLWQSRPYYTTAPPLGWNP